MNKVIQDLKVEEETIEKTQMEAYLEMEKPKREVRSYRCITNRIQETEEIISGVEDTIEEIDTMSKKIQNMKNS